MPTRFLSDAQRARYGRYESDPSRDQLARYFHLDAADREIIGRLRGAHNRLGFALQLGTARFLGVFPTGLDEIPDVVVASVAAQLDLAAAPSLASYAIGRPKKRHAAMIRETYGFRELTDDVSARFRLTRWLYTLCWSGDDRPSLLIDRATAWMLANKILLPGISTLERLVARIRDRAHRRLWRSLSDPLSQAQREKIAALLDGEGGSFRTLDALRAAPTKRAMTELTRHFERIDAIRAYGLAPPVPTAVPNALVLRLARVARTMRPSAIAAAREPRRTAMVAALFHTLEAVAIDDAVELFDALMADIFREAKAACQRKRLRSLGDLDAAALTLRTLASRVMTDDDGDTNLTFQVWRAALYADLNDGAIAEAAERVDALVRPQGDKPLEELLPKWRTTQTLFRNLLARVAFEASPEGQPATAALDYLSGVENWGKANMRDAPTGFLRGVWRKSALDEQGRIADNKAFVFAVASADGVRFSAPPTVIHAGPNPQYFQTGRGVTLYNLVSDQFTGLNALVVPGTLRDSMFILALLLDQETDLEPVEIMTDTAAYSDIVFGLFWLLGYQFSPRIADIGRARLWRIDRKADYGPLDPLARNNVNTRIIVENWEDLLRLAGSLKLGHIHAGAVMRTLQVRERATALAKALGELGKIIKSLHILSFIDDEEKRRRILTQLNRQELRHGLARRVCYGERGEIRKPYRQGQEEQLGALGFVLNTIAYWNATYMQRVLDQLETEGWIIDPADAARISPLTNRHINFLGRHAFTLPENIAAGELRPLREPNSE